MNMYNVLVGIALSILLVADVAVLVLIQQRVITLSKDDEDESEDCKR